MESFLFVECISECATPRIPPQAGFGEYSSAFLQKEHAHPKETPMQTANFHLYAKKPARLPGRAFEEHHSRTPEFLYTVPERPAARGQASSGEDLPLHLKQRVMHVQRQQIRKGGATSAPTLWLVQ